MRSLDGHQSFDASAHTYWQQPASSKLACSRSEPSAMGYGDGGRAYHYWWGLSGRRYKHKIMCLEEAFAQRASHYICVRRLENGGLVPLYSGLVSAKECRETPDVMRNQAKLMGAEDVHIFELDHMGLKDSSWAGRVERDLRAAFKVCGENPSMLHPLMSL